MHRSYELAPLKGDGIGPEIMPVTGACIDAALRAVGDRSAIWSELAMGVPQGSHTVRHASRDPGRAGASAWMKLGTIRFHVVSRAPRHAVESQRPHPETFRPLG